MSSLEGKGYIASRRRSSFLNSHNTFEMRNTQPQEHLLAMLHAELHKCASPEELTLFTRYASSTSNAHDHANASYCSERQGMPQARTWRRAASHIRTNSPGIHVCNMHLTKRKNPCYMQATVRPRIPGVPEPQARWAAVHGHDAEPVRSIQHHSGRGVCRTPTAAEGQHIYGEGKLRAAA